MNGLLLKPFTNYTLPEHTQYLRANSILYERSKRIDRNCRPHAQRPQRTLPLYTYSAARHMIRQFFFSRR